jgi:hypothetical protein
MRYRKGILRTPQTPDTDGRYIWVQDVEPETRIAKINLFDEDDLQTPKVQDDLAMINCYITNVQSQNPGAGCGCYLMPSDWIELLDIYENDVKLVTWSEWLAERNQNTLE